MTEPTFVIAEAGVNHNGDLELALALVDAAATAGADAVKFQTFRAGALVTADAQKAAYQKRSAANNEGQYEMLQRLELSPAMHEEIAKHCALRGIRFLSTPFDRDSLDFLVDSMHLRTIKLSSGEVTNGPLLLHAIRKTDRLILSTGMSTIGEVEEAVRLLAWGLDSTEKHPVSRCHLQAFQLSERVLVRLRERLTLLHCTTEYPADFADANLRVMTTMRESWGISVGLSDHTPGIAIPLAAVACGATVIEKHLTLDRGLRGPDHVASLEPEELKAMVSGIRAIEAALGDGVKRPSSAELANRIAARKSLVAARPVRRGDRLTEADIVAKRPGGGLSPMWMWDVVGSTAEHDLLPDDPISPIYAGAGGEVTEV
jgi:N-acetylneuraminate synthase